MSHSLNPPHAPQAGAIQGIIIALTAFLPILAIVSLAPAVPTLIQHFAGVPYVETLVPLMLTAPGLVIAIAGPCTGWLADKFGRRKLLLSATLLYGICGTMPLYITSLTGIFCSRLGVGLAEAVVLTIANTMLIDYFDDKQRRFWLTVQGGNWPGAGGAGAGQLRLSDRPALERRLYDLLCRHPVVPGDVLLDVRTGSGGPSAARCPGGAA
ncbi:MFS transporter [Klebsiella variicola]|nr:MFS transporter [Klebsiella variicola]